MIKFLGVAALAAVDLFLAVPAGIAAKLGFVQQFLAMVIGGSIGATAAVFLSDALKRVWQAQRKVRSPPKAAGFVGRLTKRWGAPGLGLASPILIGTPAGALLGIGVGLNRAALLIWLLAGVVLWSAVISGLVALGVTAFS